jgi:hypothetical protein
VLDGAIDRLARVEVSAKTGGGQVMVNNPLYRLLDVRLDAARLDATFALDWFAHYALSYDLLESELLDALRGQLAQEGSAPPGLALPMRDRLLGDVDAVASLSRRLCAGGQLALFAIARPASWNRKEDFLLVVQQRSDRVVNVHGGLAVIPKGFHQHTVSARDEVYIGATLYRELEEELFGRAEFDASPGQGAVGLNLYTLDRLSVPMRWLAERNAITAECVAFGLNLVTGNYEFANILCIQDEEFWTRHGGSCMPNWEAAGVQTYSSSDAAGLGALVHDGRWTNEGLFALLEGLRSLARRFPDRVELPPWEMLVG